MGIQKGLHSKGCIHIYTHVPFHVFLQILSCTSPLGCSLAEKLFVLTQTCTVQALFGSREPIPSHISAQFDREEKGIRPAKVWPVFTSDLLNQSTYIHISPLAPLLPRTSPCSLPLGSAQITWDEDEKEKKGKGGDEQPCRSCTVQLVARRGPKQSQVLCFLS